MKVIFKKDTQPNWIQKLIGWRTYSYFSHVEIWVDDMCYSSVFPRGVRGEKADVVFKNPRDWVVVDIDILNIDKNTIKEWFEVRKGKPYDTRSLVEILGGKPSSDPEAFNCAESVLCSLQQAGILTWYDSSRATPEGLYLALKGLVEGRTQ